MTEVIMPKMGDGMEEGTLVDWTVKDGDKVSEGDVIGEIQTDKATLELEAPESGTLTGLLIGANDTVPVGQAIGLILEDGESVPDGWGSGNGAPAAKAEEAVEQKEEKSEKAAPAEAPKASESNSNGRIKASPLARRIAGERGIDLAGISGSGPGGRIVKADVESAQPSSSGRASAPAASDSKLSLNNLRRITAERTLSSKQGVPHFYVTVGVDVEAIFELREAFKAQEAGKISVNDYVIRACVKALQEMPVVNSEYKGDHLLQHGAIHIGMAAAMEDGLMVPVIRNAQNLTLREIADESRRLVEAAKNKKLGPDEMQGSTFSISNMGMLNVDSFSAIINEPNAAIIAIGTAKREAVPVSDDELEIRWRMNITGSFDHRVVDGAVGADFMNVVRGYLENPARLLS